MLLMPFPGLSNNTQTHRTRCTVSVTIATCFLTITVNLNINRTPLDLMYIHNTILAYVSFGSMGSLKPLVLSMSNDACLNYLCQTNFGLSLI